MTPRAVKAAAKEGPQKKVKAALAGREYVLINAENQVLGRLAVRIAQILSGKLKTSFARHKDNGDAVIVINAAKVRVTGAKMKDKSYRTFSGYPSGHKEKTLERTFQDDATEPLRHAVRGMLPKNSLGNHMLLKLKIYSEAKHPHAAQKPKELKLP